MSVDEVFQAGVSAHMNGQPKEARTRYLAVLEREPEHSGALSNLGRLARAEGDNTSAKVYYETAVRAPNAPGEVFFNLANLLIDLNQTANVEELFAKAADKAPQLAQIHLKRIRFLQQHKKMAAALEATRFALTHHRQNADILAEFGRLLAASGKLRDALRPTQLAVAGGFKDDGFATRLAQSLLEAGDGDSAVALMRQLVAGDKENASHHFNLGYCYRKSGHYLKALQEMRTVQDLAPQFSGLAVEISNLLVNCGRPQEAREMFAKQLSDPELRERAISGYLMSLLYDPDMSGEDIRIEHQKLTADWSCAPAPKKRQPKAGKLKVGYLTGDFHGNHPVAQFLLPIVRRHEDIGIEAYAYVNFRERDDVAAEFAQYCQFREAWGKSDDEVAELIRKDGLDLLIDLSGHSSGNRLRVLGQRPAPVQACFVGYPSTTGFAAVDYLITDRRLAPPERSACYSEMMAYLPDAFLCFQPLKGMPDPMLKPENRERVVFGTLNHFPKLNEGLIKAWADILTAVPNSVFLFKCGAFSESETQDLAAGLFKNYGIERDRLILQPPSVFEEAMKVYREIDIALDTFPYNGGTTTCQALWTGTPVVTLAGENFCGRMGASLITAAGHPEWVTQSVDEYVACAVELATDRQKMTEINRQLCKTIMSSPMCAIEPYAKAFGELCRKMAERSV